MQLTHPTQPSVSAPDLLHAPHALRPFLAGACLVLLAGCASTTVTLEPAPQAPVCDPAQSALIVWAPKWRANQKDVAAREQAAATGIQNFFASSGCFANYEIRRVANLASPATSAQLDSAATHFQTRVGIEVRELGPIVQLLSSAALVEGGTEVVLQITTYPRQAAEKQRQFNVHWKNGGAGVIKGVGSLPSDMQAALRAGLQPSSPAP